MSFSQNKKTVAVVGSGISGIVVAYLLDQSYNVLLIEADQRLGGHTHSVAVNDSELGITNIDTGFIVFNSLNYPVFETFLDQLGVESQDSDMSFGFHNRAQSFWYSSDFPKGVFSKKSNLFSIRFWKFLNEIKVFNQRVFSDLDRDIIGELSLEDYLNTLPLSSFFKESYVFPMGAAIWSCPIHKILEFPAKQFFAFWKNHCLLTLGKRPTWKTVSGGSRTYIDHFLKRFKGKVLTGSPVTSVRSENEEIIIRLASGEEITVDHAVIATHADQALKILANPTQLQSSLLGAWSYSDNDVYLHSDASVMPPSIHAWASWVVTQEGHLNDRLTMTYYMNRLQHLRSRNPYFVTLNPGDSISEQHVIKKISYTHPIYDAVSVASQKDLPLLNEGPILFCGSYFGNGFHEDGARSAVEACRLLGVSL